MRVLLLPSPPQHDSGTQRSAAPPPAVPCRHEPKCSAATHLTARLVAPALQLGARLASWRHLRTAPAPPLPGVVTVRLQRRRNPRARQPAQRPALFHRRKQDQLQQHALVSGIRQGVPPV